MAITIDYDSAYDKAVVEALVEKLVDPRLPRAVSEDPSEDSQKSVAKQMHAVALIYYYYHRMRKQNPDPDCVGFATFCRWTQSMRKSLTSFMKCAKNPVPAGGLTDPDQLSITEKAIKDACNIAESLYASKDVQVTEGLPISKVAVLLIDSEKKDCFLMFGTVTEGVWSPIEKEIDESSISLDILAEQKESKKRRTDNEQTSSYNDRLLQIAYEAVKNSAGISSSDLVVLEAHVVPSLSKEKSAAQFFIMQCSQSLNRKDSVALDELVNILQGPLVEMDNIGCTSEPVIEYFHLLPYAGFISSWLSRKDLPSKFLNGYDAKSTNNYDEKELAGSKDLGQDEINGSGTKNEVVLGNSESQQHKRKHSSGGNIASPVSVAQSSKEHGNVVDEFKDIGDLFLKKRAGKVKGSTLNFVKPGENDETKEWGYVSDPATTVRGTNAILNNSVSARTRGSIKGKDIKNPNPKPASRTRRKKAPSPQLDVRGPEDDVNLMVETTEPPKSNDRLPRNEKVTAENSGKNVSCNQNEVAAKENPLAESEDVYIIGVGNSMASVPLKNKTAAASLRKSHGSLQSDEGITPENGGANIPHNPSGVAATENPQSNPEALRIRVENAMLSRTERNAATLLRLKSQEVCSRIHSMLDEVAEYEGAFERIMGGGEHDLASRCLRNIADGNDHLLLNEIRGQDNGHLAAEETKNKLVFPGNSSCQDLEFICLKNDWTLPSYVVLPNYVHPRTTYMAYVMVKIKDFVMTAKTDSKSSPSEAREDCAAQMIARIKHTFS